MNNADNYVGCSNISSYGRPIVVLSSLTDTVPESL